MAVARGEQADAEGVFDSLIVANKRGKELGEIERAAAADADDAVGSAARARVRAELKTVMVGSPAGARSMVTVQPAASNSCCMRSTTGRERGRVDDMDASRAQRCEIGDGFREAAGAEGEAVGLQEGDGPHAHRLLGESGARLGFVLHCGDGFLRGVERKLSAGLEADDVVGAEEQVDAEAQPVVELRGTAGGDDLFAVLTGDADDVLGGFEQLGMRGLAGRCRGWRRDRRGR